MRELILNLLEKRGRSRSWLASQAAELDVCSASLVMRYLQGKCDITTRKAEALVEILGADLTSRRSFKSRTIRK